MYYLYLKTHYVTGKQYLGQTKKNPYLYHGSGKLWSKHIKKYGYNVNTIILAEHENIKYIGKLGLIWSKYYNIINNDNFLNLINECGPKPYTPPSKNIKDVRSRDMKLIWEKRKSGLLPIPNMVKSKESKEKHSRIMKNRWNDKHERIKLIIASKSRWSNCTEERVLSAKRGWETRRLTADKLITKN